MVGAAVATPDGRRGTVTDSNGRYSLTLGAGDALISVSYLGYVTRQIVIGDRTEVDVQPGPRCQKHHQRGGGHRLRRGEEDPT